VEVGVIAAATAAGAALGALLAPALWLYARLVLRLGLLPALLAGPPAGAAAGIGVLCALVWIFDGNLRDEVLLQFGVAGAGAAGPPWAAYLAVRHKQRATIGVVVGTAVWTILPAALLAVLLRFR
jgi:hypothetical protein